MSAATEQFRQAIVAAGLTPPDTIDDDGNIHRFASNGKRGDDAGWYVYHANGIPAGSFGCWRLGITETWHADIGRKLSFAEVEALKRKAESDRTRRDAAEKQRHDEACKRAAELWNIARPAPADHPYLARKAVKAYGVRVHDGQLVVPMREAGELKSLQFIAPDGDKLFLPGGRVRGCYYSIGKPNEWLCIAEGFATGATVHEATGLAVAVAFNAGNLAPVARAMRERFPDAAIVLCADDDYRTAGNPGLTKATEAARAVVGLVAVPDFGDDRPDGATDFNDLAKQRGTEAVERAVANARGPDAPEAQPDSGNATAADSAPPRFRSVTMLELVNAELPQRVALLAPWLLTQGLAQVHAWRGVGKTHFSLGVAYAVATGGAFLRWQAQAPRRVLFLDGEMPAVALKERLAAIIAADDRDIDVDAEMLRFVTPDLLDGAPPDLANPDDQAELQRVIAEHDPALIVVDNISTLVRSGGGENDAEAWIPVQTWALRMRRDGRAALFVHHTGKGGKQRGTSKREDILDAAIALTHPEPYDPADGARFVVTFEKGRYLRGDDARSFEAQLSTDARGLQTWTTKDIDDSTVERVAALHRDGITNLREIAEELGVNKSTVSRALRRARDQGLIAPEAA